MIVLLPSVNRLHFYRREIPTFSFYIDWFTRNYKYQTDSKLPESGLCAHIILQGRHGKLRQLLGSLYGGKIKHRKAVQQADSGFQKCINYSRFTDQFKYHASSDLKWMNYGLPVKTYHIAKTTPLFDTYLFSTLSVCFCLFDLILYVPSTIFQLNRDGFSGVEPVLS